MVETYDTTSANITASAPAPDEEHANCALCSLCGITRVFRRSLCRSCYRKCSAARIPLPRRARRGPAPWSRSEHIQSWLRKWPPAALAELRRFFVELDAQRARR